MRPVGELDGHEPALLDEQDRDAARRGSGPGSRTASRRSSARARATARRAAARPGRATSARAIASCCCWPPESAPAWRFANSATTGKSPRTQSRSSATPSWRATPGEPEPQVLVDGQRGEDVPALGNERDARRGRCPPAGRGAAARRAGSRPPRRGTSPMIAWSVRRLAGAVRADQPDDLAALEPQVEPAHGRHAAVAHVDARAARGGSASRLDLELRPRDTPSRRRSSGGSRSGVPSASVRPAVEHVDPVADLHDQRRRCGRSGARPRRSRRGRSGRRRRRRGSRPRAARPRARPSARTAAGARAPARRRAGARRRAAGPRPLGRRALARPSRLEQLGRRAAAPRAGETPPPRAATSTFSRTVRPRNSRPCWKVRASPARPRRCGGQRVISVAPSSIRPDDGRSKPVRRLTSVVFPAPLGPIRPSTSSGASSRSTSSSA